MKVKVIGFYPADNGVPHESEEIFEGNWANDVSHVRFTNSLYSKYFGLRISSYQNDIGEKRIRTISGFISVSTN